MEPIMKLTIIAATGGVGRELLEQALDAGHDVTAVVRNPDKLSREVRAVTTDMTAPDPAALESALAGTSERSMTISRGWRTSLPAAAWTGPSCGRRR
jgi:putative NADH-flavin reductase